MSELLIERCSIVLVGSWNPAIITPNWLKAQFPELIKSTEFETVYVPGPTPTVRFVVEDVLVDSTGGRLRLNPNKPDQACLQFIPRLALAIYNKLPHTPIFAAGYNFLYKLASNESPAAFDFVRNEEQTRFYQDLGLTGMTQARIRHTFAQPTHQLNLRFDRGEEPDLLSLNFHYNVSQTPEVRAAIESFSQNYTTAETLTTKLIKQQS